MSKHIDLDELCSRPRNISLTRLDGGSSGSPGSAVIKEDLPPPLFFISHDQLWQYHNDSYIFPVNVLNSTLTAQAPLQLNVGNRREGLSGGSWWWRGTMLYYNHGDKTNRGLFYACQDKAGHRGVYMVLDL